MTLETWLIFVAVWIAAGIPLGPNAVNCIAISSSSGFRAALWSVLGILLAAFCFIAAVTVGLASLLTAHAGLFTVLKLCGGAYLIWMGIALWRKSSYLNLATRRQPPNNPARIVKSAFLISLSNPKAILAYGAVFSQFLDPAQPLGAQLIVLIPTAQCLTAMIYVAYSGIGLGVGRVLKTELRRRLFNRVIAGFYMLVGGALISTEAVNTAAPVSAR